MLDEILAILTLISIPTFLGLKFLHEYQNDWSNHWYFSEKLASILFALYLLLVLFVGRNEIYSLAASGVSHHKFMTFYALPSLAFGIAMFPKSAIEYSDLYFKSSLLGTQRWFAFTGWMYITILFLTLAV